MYSNKTNLFKFPGIADAEGNDKTKFEIKYTDKDTGIQLNKDFNVLFKLIKKSGDKYLLKIDPTQQKASEDVQVYLVDVTLSETNAPMMKSEYQFSVEIRPGEKTGEPIDNKPTIEKTLNFTIG